MRYQDAIQRAREIKDAAEGDTIPGDPDHGKWARAEPGPPPMAEPMQGRAPHLPLNAQPVFNLPTRSLPPITVAPDNLAQFNRPTGLPGRRVIPPKPL